MKIRKKIIIMKILLILRIKQRIIKSKKKKKIMEIM